jgi:hypothetical protein
MVLAGVLQAAPPIRVAIYCLPGKAPAASQQGLYEFLQLPQYKKSIVAEYLNKISPEELKKYQVLVLSQSKYQPKGEGHGIITEKEA